MGSYQLLSRSAVRVDKGTVSNYSRARGENWTILGEATCVVTSLILRADPLPARTSGRMGWGICVPPWAR